MKSKSKGHICLDCSQVLNLQLKLPVKLCINKCTKCKKSKTGVSRKNYERKVMQ